MVPDSPYDLTNDSTVTEDTRIKFTWVEGANNGGTPVIDYTIYYDQGIGTYVKLSENILPTEFTTENNLTPGTVYTFKVAARNNVGESIQSEPISILAAQEPDIPINLVEVTG